MAIRPLPYRSVRQKLLSIGFIEASQRGSHVKFVRTGRGGAQTVIDPRHREIAAGTPRSIARQAGLTSDELEKL